MNTPPDLLLRRRRGFEIEALARRSSELVAESPAPDEQLGPTSAIPLASLRTALVGGWPAGASWIPDDRAAALRALAQPCGSTVMFPLRLTPGSRLRARVSLPTSGPLAARVQVSTRDAAGSETVLWSRIIARLGGYSVPPSFRVDVPLGTAGEVDLILRAMPVAPGVRAQGPVLWRNALVEVAAALAPPLPDRAPDTRPPPRPKSSGGAPLISVLTPVHDPDPQMLAAAVASVRRQTLEAWELCLVDDGSRDPRVIEMLDRCAAEDPRIRLVRRDRSGGISVATNDALRMATGEYVACLDHDDELVGDALETVAAAIDEQPDADLVYTDEDLVLDGQPEDIALKPDWSPDLFRSTMYLCHLHVTRRSLALELGGFRPEFDGSQDYDFILRVSERARRIVHIPRVLYHWRVHERSVAGSETAKPYAYSAARRAVAEHLTRTGVEGDVHFGVFPGVTRVVHHVPPETRAAVILAVTGELPTTAEEVARAVNSWALCEYRPHELVLVGARDVIAACGERLPADGSARRLVAVEAPLGAGAAVRINMGAAAAESDYLVVLDGPVESLTRDWLVRLVGFASQPEVGAAGGKVLAADGRVENAGVLLSDGLPLPLLHGADPGRERPLSIGRVPFNLSAVGGAVAIRHETFIEFGGLVEQLGPLGVVDFCLRARERGMRIVSASDAVLRRTDRAVPVNDLAALHAFRMRWRDRLGRDPYFHPGYYGDRGDFVFRPELYGWEVSNRWRGV